MSKANDEFGKRILAALQSTPAMDQQVAIEEKRKFLNQVEKVREGLIPENGSKDHSPVDDGALLFSKRHPRPVLKAVVAIWIVLVLLVGSSLTVYAAHDSLPGEPLYPIKSLSEDIRLSLARSPQARLEITLDYTNRRMSEISHLLEIGKSLPAQASNRYQIELESALQLAAEMEDEQMLEALREIKNHAENQGITFEELIKKVPGHAESGIVHLQERLREQVSLSTIGETDPKTFRWEILKRQRGISRNHKSIGSDTTDTPTSGASTPLPEQDENHEDGNRQPSQIPGSEEKNQGQGNQNPGNGNHGVEPSRTPKP